MKVTKILEIINTGNRRFSEEEIRECIKKTATKLETTEDEIFDSILEYFENYIIDLNFVNGKFSEKFDDQSSFGPSDEDQEYLKKNFRKTVIYKYPIFDEFSVIPHKFKNQKYWVINRQLKTEIPHLENTHWTNQTLSYARNNITAKHIVKCIVKPLFEKGLFGSAKNITVVDATGNIGMDSITFGLEKFVKKVYTYEILSNVYEMLWQNIKLYGLDYKMHISNKRFDYDSTVLNNALVMIDPPYESGNNSGNFNLSIDNKPIYYVVEDILNKGARCVILSMPKTYKYNLDFAKKYNQHVVVYQMGKINNKLFLIVHSNQENDGILPPFGSFTEIHQDETKKLWNGQQDHYQCSSTRITASQTLIKQFQTQPVNLKISYDSKVQILKKIFGKDLVYSKDSKVDIQKTLEKHLNTKEDDDKWGFGKSVNTFSKKNINLIRHLPSNISSYCDIGCGTGSDMEAMHKKFNIQKSYCVDIKDQRVHSSGSFVNAKDLLKLDPQQVISLFHTIHHIDPMYLGGSLKSYMTQIYNLLQPGGFLLIKDHDVRSFEQAANVDFEHLSYTVSYWKNSLNELLKHYDTIEPMTYYSKARVLKDCTDIGFKVLWEGEMSKLTYIYGAVLKK
jgi:16S rRNA G966 N2-methylase RsmD/SAM-dependent methyltransferase